MAVTARPKLLSVVIRPPIRVSPRPRVGEYVTIRTGQGPAQTGRVMGYLEDGSLRIALPDA
jgi:hypothetical protein